MRSKSFLRTLALVVVFFSVLVPAGTVFSANPVKGNTFSSEVSPRLTVEFLDKYKYLGEFSKNFVASTVDGHNLNVDMSRYFFVQGNTNKKVSSFCEIFTYKSQKYGINLSAFTKSIKHKIYENDVSISGMNFRECVYLSTTKAEKYFQEKGYIAPKLVISRGLEAKKTSEDMVFVVIYSEALGTLVRPPGPYNFDSWLDFNLYDQTQKAAVQRFVEKAQKVITIKQFTE